MHAPHSACSQITSPPFQERILDSHPQRDAMAVKVNAHVRLHSLPYCLDPQAGPGASLLNPGIARIGSAHLGRLLALSGTVVRTGAIKVFEAHKLFFCNRCKHQCVGWGCFIVMRGLGLHAVSQRHES